MYVVIHRLSNDFAIYGPWNSFKQAQWWANRYLLPDEFEIGKIREPLIRENPAWREYTFDEMSMFRPKSKCERCGYYPCCCW